MIEREFIRQKAKYLKIKEYIENRVSKAVGIGSIVIEKTPMGEKIIISAVRPGLIIGRGGKSITELTSVLRAKFKLENPQIEVQEVENPFVNATIVARRMAADLERFGAKRYKSIGYRALTNILGSGAIGAEIRISGKGIPGKKARSWRFYGGYMKKCGDVAVTGVDSAQSRANLRSGTVGIKVRIMPQNIALPDRIHVKEIAVEPVPKAQLETKEISAAPPAAEVKKPIETKPEEKESKKKKPTKKAPKKKAEKKLKPKKKAQSEQSSAAPSSEAAREEKKPETKEVSAVPNETKEKKEQPTQVETKVEKTEAKE